MMGHCKSDWADLQTAYGLFSLQQKKIAHKKNKNEIKILLDQL